MGTVTLFVKHERPADGVETITVDQSLSGGFGASSESRILDWEQRSADSKLYGKTFIRTKRVTVDELDNAWLKEGWVDEVREHGLILNSVQSEPKNGKTWYTDIVSTTCVPNSCGAEACSRPGASKRLGKRRGTPGTSPSPHRTRRKSTYGSSTIIVSTQFLRFLMALAEVLLQRAR